MRPMEPKEIARRYLEEGLCAELTSSPELHQRSVRIRRAFPDLTVEALEMLVEGDRVAAHFVARGTHEGVFQGVPPTRCEIEATCTAIYRVEDGLIAEAWTTWDSLGLLEQLGAVERVETVSA